MCDWGFNKIINQSEKLGGKLRPLKQIKDFRLALEMNGLVDLGWRNQIYTSSNIHFDSSFTKKRLDRTVKNQSWLNIFGSVKVDVLPSS